MKNNIGNNLKSKKMKTNYTEEQKYIRAKRTVEKLKEFYANLIAYLVVIPFLIFVNLQVSPGFHWFWFPMLGWGIGVLFHGFSVYNNNIFFGKEWEERKIKEYMDKYN